MNNNFHIQLVQNQKMPKSLTLRLLIQVSTVTRTLTTIRLKEMVSTSPTINCLHEYRFCIGIRGYVYKSKFVIINDRLFVTIQAADLNNMRDEPKADTFRFVRSGRKNSQ